MSHAPPVARLALAFGAGVACVLGGASLALAAVGVAVLFLLPIAPWRGPSLRRVWVAAAAAGAIAAHSAGARDCALGTSGTELGGHFLSAPRWGSGPFLPVGGCRAVTVLIGDAAVPAGHALRLEGAWREGSRGVWFVAHSVTPEGGDDDALRWRLVRWRDRLVGRLVRLYGERAPLVAALTLARREGFDPDLRETFARTGLAHLLAISGFHVGVIAALAAALLRAFGLARRPANVGAALVAGGYVALIGFPDAACRAALIFGLVAAAESRGRPPARWGALASAFLILLSIDPTKLARVGFQLSFAGAGGLVAWSRPIGGWVRRISRGRCPRWLQSGLGSGVSATLATLPIVAWHFERIALVGVPATLVAGPLVALALPGAIASLVLDAAFPPAGRFLAGGVDLLLEGLERGTALAAGWRWSSVWVSRGMVTAAVAGFACARHASRRPRVGGGARRALTLVYASAAVAGWPLLVSLQGLGSVELLVIDVGQGDAIALRSPRGRWILVDAGPPSRDPDPGAHPVVRALRARAVRRLEALVLTHPDLDHIGGAGAVLSAFDVGAVLDPAVPAGKEAFVDVLAEAAERGIPWRAARTGDVIDIDGLFLRVLHPTGAAALGAADANATSVVVHASFGSFDVLLTGDADKAVERGITGLVHSGFEVLKVGHHGSDTSTDPLLLEAANPVIALVSVGRGNRYGHPAPEVIERLARAGVELHRTDREGSLTVLGRRDGSWTLASERRPARGGEPAPR